MKPVDKQSSWLKDSREEETARTSKTGFSRWAKRMMSRARRRKEKKELKND